MAANISATITAGANRNARIGPQRARLQFYGVGSNMASFDKGPDLRNGEWLSSIDNTGAIEIPLIRARTDDTPDLCTITWIKTSGDTIGFQSKPAQGATTTGDVYGCQLSPRISATFGAGSLIGAAFQPILKGSSGNLSGDFRGCQVDLTDDNLGGRTVAGDVIAMRVFQQLACTVTGDVCVLSVAAGGGATPWTHFMKLPDDDKLAHSTKVSATGAGYIRVKIGSAVRYITLTSGAPS